MEGRERREDPRLNGTAGEEGLVSQGTRRGIEKRRQGRGRVAAGQKDIWLCIMYLDTRVHTPSPFT